MEKCISCGEPTDERLDENWPPICEKCADNGKIGVTEDGFLIVKIKPLVKETEIEDATKPSFEITTEVEMKMKETPIGKSVLKNVRLEASLGRTINVGGHDFLKPNAGISGDVGDRDRAAGWQECWREVEYQLGDEIGKMLTMMKVTR